VEKPDTVDTVHDGSRINAPEGPPKEFIFKPIILERIDPDLFRALPEYLWKPPGARAVFGGQVLGQSLSAASQTVEPGLSLHSFHAYFVRAGQPETSIVYDVKRVRNGRSFATRAVSAKQGGKWIFSMQASFHRPEYSSLEHQTSMPTVPQPETLPTEVQKIQAMIADPATPKVILAMLKRRPPGHLNPIDVRTVFDSTNYDSEEAKALSKNLRGMGIPSQMYWFKTRHRLPNDEHVHHAILAYQSDAGLMSTARVDKGAKFWAGGPMMASLDHAMWFHLPFPNWRADEWLLYVMYSPRLTGSRGLSHGHIFTQDGRLVVSCTQEGLIRLAVDKDQSDPVAKSML